jgi:hypothetical protein
VDALCAQSVRLIPRRGLTSSDRGVGADILAPRNVMRGSRIHPSLPCASRLLSPRCALAVLLVGCSAHAATAQSQAAGQSVTEGTAAAGVLQPRLEIVDQGTEDRDVLSATLRTDPTDLRLPTEFERVYRVPGSSTLLMRGNGALFAVFEQSVYRQTSRGIQVVAPPGTVFHIGMPSAPTMRRDPATKDPATNDTATNDAATKSSDARRVPTPVAAPVNARIGPVRTSAASARPSQSPLVRSELRGERDDAATPTGFEHAHKPSLASPRVSSPANATPSTQTDDPYAHLQLGPARIVHAETLQQPCRNPAESVSGEPTDTRTRE